MRLVDQFYSVPGRCFFTGSSDTSKPILDTDHHVEGEGRVYIGGEFLEEACRMLGWVPPAEAEFLALENEALTERVVVAEAALADRSSLEELIAKAVPVEAAVNLPVMDVAPGLKAAVNG